MKFICQFPRLIESWYPLFFSLISGACLISMPPEWLTAKACVQLANSYAVVMALIFSSAFASVALLITLSENQFIKGARQSGAYGMILNYHFSCLKWCALSLLVAFTITYLPEEDVNLYFRIAFISVGIGACFSTLRIVRLMGLLLRCLKLLD